MKTRLLFIGMLLMSVSMFGQEIINVDAVKFDNDVFIFEGMPTITKCDQAGIPTAAPNKEQAPLNATFTIHRLIAGSTNYVIKFKGWETSKKGFLSSVEKALPENIDKARKFNFIQVALPAVPAPPALPPIVNKFNSSNGAKTKAPAPAALGANEIVYEDAYFIISKSDLLLYAKKYNPIPKVDFTFGTIAYLARIRPRVDGISSKWSTDLSGGVAYGPRFRLNRNWGISLLGGVTITKVNLDAISTRGYLSESVEKVALTPMLNTLFNYKNFTFGGAIGFDWINEDTEESKAWVYNKKLFWSFGIGFNIFTSTEEQKVTNSSDQNKKS